ncbi:MAG TPA: amidohydrolase family protein, partial [SAR202 cluster bacterium]|nr:amidohydrolase family protein [SAR202 cluster bacterium]
TFAVYKYHSEKGTPHGKRRASELKTDHTKSLLAAMDQGVKIVAGTDAGGWVHGNNAEELVCLVEAGMSPSQAILAGTQTAAECIGLQEELGTIEKGKKADLLFVSQNPLEYISCLQFGETVSLVMKGGEVVSDKRHESL